MPTDNKAFEAMGRAARARLAGRDPQALAAGTGIPFDAAASAFTVPSLGRVLTVSWPEFAVSPAVDPWHELVLLHYLDVGDGTAPTGRLMSFASLPDGMARGGGFDRQSEQTMAQELANRDPAAIRAACEALGAAMVPSNADLCAVFPFLPLYPVTMKLWYPEEDLPGSGRMFLDESAGHYMAVEDAITVGGLILEGVLARLK